MASNQPSSDEQEYNEYISWAHQQVNAQRQKALSSTGPQPFHPAENQDIPGLESGKISTPESRAPQSNLSSIMGAAHAAVNGFNRLPVAAGEMAGDKLRSLLGMSQLPEQPSSPENDKVNNEHPMAYAAGELAAPVATAGMAAAAAGPAIVANPITQYLAKGASMGAGYKLLNSLLGKQGQ